MKTRNQVPSLGFARIHFVRAITLLLTASLTLISPQPAGANYICTMVPQSVGCITAKGSSLQVVVNKTRPLNPRTYRPSDLVRVPQFNPLGRILRKYVSSAVVRMGIQMKADGKGTLVVQDGFRGYSSQKTVHDAKVRAIGKIKGEKWVARPGYSEHQTGLAVDFAAAGVSTLHISFAKTKAGIWLAANAYKYGFVLRYPKGKTAITGYRFEPWHFRYVGVEVATDMHEKKVLTLEEYYGLPAAPRYLD